MSVSTGSTSGSASRTTSSSSVQAEGAGLGASTGSGIAAVGSQATWTTAVPGSSEALGPARTHVSPSLHSSSAGGPTTQVARKPASPICSSMAPEPWTDRAAVGGVDTTLQHRTPCLMSPTGCPLASWTQKPSSEPRSNPPAARGRVSSGGIAPCADGPVPYTGSGGPRGVKSVAYAELTAVLINAIKEQQETIEDLKTRITELEN